MAPSNKQIFIKFCAPIKPFFAHNLARTARTHARTHARTAINTLHIVHSTTTVNVETLLNISLAHETDPPPQTGLASTLAPAFFFCFFVIELEKTPGVLSDDDAADHALKLDTSNASASTTITTRQKTCPTRATLATTLPIHLGLGWTHTHEAPVNSQTFKQQRKSIHSSG